MKPFSLRKLIALLSFVFICSLSSLVTTAQDKDWRPVSQDELGSKTPVVEPDADAEAILWEVYVSDEDSGGSLQTVLDHYVKIKIFNERGREAFSKIDIPYGKIEGIGV